MWRSVQRADLYTKLATLVDAGIPLLRALEAAAEGERGLVRTALVQVRQSVAKGTSLAEAMGRYRSVFGAFDRLLVDTADTSGKLEECFKLLADWYQFLRRVRNVMLKGLIYPLFILHMAALVVPLPRLVYFAIMLMMIRQILRMAGQIGGPYNIGDW